MTVPFCPRCQSPMSGSDREPYCPQCAGRLLLGTNDGGIGADSPPLILRLGNYELGAELGRGAMGVVYRARQPGLKRDVAVKVILASRFAGEAARKRFLAEAELAAQLDHPNIVPIYEVGETPDGPFYAMKLVEGGTLADQLTRSSRRKEAHSQVQIRSEPPHVGCYEGKDAAQLLAKIARAVHHAHQRGVLHRDLKPGNILLDAQGEPHVTDFGLARQLGADSSLTLSGSSLGTPAYMSPEQARGGKGITTASDVWSLGAILYHLLAGGPPFTGDTAVEVMRKVMEEEPVPPSQVRSRRKKAHSEEPEVRSAKPEMDQSLLTSAATKIDRDLETICLKCLEKDPVRRYGSALALAEDLERWLKHEPIRARPSTAVERVTKWARRRPAIAALTALACVLGIVAITGITWQWRRANKHAAAVDSALLQTRDALWQANFDRAHALRTSRRMGQRVEALAAIRAAAAIRPTPELREEAIAAMALTDLEDIGLWFQPPTNGVRSATDAQLEHLAVSRPDGVVEVRRLSDRTLLSQWTNSSRMADVQFSEAGNVLLANDQVLARVWDWQSPRLLAECPAKTGRFGGPALSPDGQWLVFPDSTSSVVWRNLQTGRDAGRIDGLDNPHDLAWSPNNEWLALKSGGETQVRRLSDGAKLGALVVPSGGGWLKWHPHEPLLTIGGADRLIYVWDVASNRVKTLAGHRREGIMLWWHQDGELLSSTSWDDVLRLWDPYAGTQLLETRIGRPRSFSTEGRWLAVNGARGIGRLQVHLPKGSRLFHTRLGLKPGVTQFSRDGRFLVGARTDDSWVCIWDVESGQRRAEITLNAMKTAQFYGDRQLLTASREGVLLWTNLHSADGWEPSRVRTVIQPDGGHAGFVMSPDSTRLLMGREGGGDVYEFPSGRLQFKLRGQPLFGNVAFSGDGQWIASGYWNNGGKRGSEFFIWSATNGQSVRKIPMGNCAAHFSADGRCLLAAADNEYFQFAIGGHPTNWPLVRRFTRETSGFLHGPAAFSGDGTLLALMADSTVVRLIEADSGRELARFTPLPDVNGIAGLHFSHDGRWLEADTDLGPHVWDIALIRARLREMNLDWDGPPNLHVTKPRSEYGLQPVNRSHFSHVSGPTNTGPAEAGTPNIPREFPPRSPDATPAQLDLTPHFNALLTENWCETTPQDNSLSALPRGLQTLDDVTWDIRAIVQLSSAVLRRTHPKYPAAVSGLEVGQPCRRLHFLTAYGSAEKRRGTEAGHYVIHYADGEEMRVPVRVGEEIGDFWFDPKNPQPVRFARVAWKGQNERALGYKASLQLFHWTWDNPRPDAVVTSLDFVSAMNRPAPFLLAITTE